MTLKEQLLSLVRNNPGKTATELAYLLHPDGDRKTSKDINIGLRDKNRQGVASALYRLSVKEHLIDRRNEPDSRALPKLEADTTQYVLYKLTGEFNGHTAHRYYPIGQVGQTAQTLL